MSARDYPHPCETCEKAKTCRTMTGCAAWKIRYRYRQKQINAYAKRKKEEIFATKFAYQHPDETRRYLQQWPCEHCEQAEDCDIPCGKYMDWYNARIEVAKKKAGV